MDNKDILDILAEFTHISILKLDIEGNIKQILYNSNECIKFKKGIHIQDIFSLRDRERVKRAFEQGVGVESRYIKIANKYCKGLQYVNIKVKDIQGEIYIYLIQTQSKTEKELQYQEKIQELSLQAQVDQLTGLLNRHGYWERVKRILNCGDKERKIGILFLDIDGLKAINTALGHKGGDKAINQISTLISNSIRHRDIAVRYGGDEFVIVVEELTGSRGTALGLAKRMLKEINSSRSKYLTTVSIGVHVVKVGDIVKKGLSSKSLQRRWEDEVAKADEKAYEAKEKGKNTVIFT